MSKHLGAISLASQSPRRKDLLRSLGLRVTIVGSAYREAAHSSTNDPSEAALRHALGKASHAGPSGPPILVAADTIVALDGEMLGKPSGAHEATAMLRKLSGRDHRVYTGFVVSDRKSGRLVSGVESTKVRFMPLRDEDIAAYVATRDPLDKAGGYGIQGRGSLLIRSISGDFYTVMGLPLARIGVALQELGYTLLAP